MHPSTPTSSVPSAVTANLIERDVLVARGRDEREQRRRPALHRVRAGQRLPVAIDHQAPQGRLIGDGVGDRPHLPIDGRRLLEQVPGRAPVRQAPAQAVFHSLGVEAGERARLKRRPSPSPSTCARRRDRPRGSCRRRRARPRTRRAGADRDRPSWTRDARARPGPARRRNRVALRAARATCRRTAAREQSTCRRLRRPDRGGFRRARHGVGAAVSEKVPHGVTSPRVRDDVHARDAERGPQPFDRRFNRACCRHDVLPPVVGEPIQPVGVRRAPRATRDGSRPARAAGRASRTPGRRRHAARR